MQDDVDCLVCQKHRAAGPLVGPVLWSDDIVVVTHRPAGPDTGRAVPGYVFVEPREHVARWHHLTAEQSAAVSRAAWAAARVLAEWRGTDQVFTAVVGQQIAHVHQHVFVRHSGTPASVPWYDSAEWSGAPRLSAADLADAVAGLRERFAAEAPAPGAAATRGSMPG